MAQLLDQLAIRFPCLTALDLTSSVGVHAHEVQHLTHLALRSLALQGSYETGDAALLQVLCFCS